MDKERFKKTKPAPVITNKMKIEKIAAAIANAEPQTQVNIYNIYAKMNHLDKIWPNTSEIYYKLFPDKKTREHNLIHVRSYHKYCKFTEPFRYLKSCDEPLGEGWLDIHNLSAWLFISPILKNIIETFALELSYDELKSEGEISEYEIKIISASIKSKDIGQMIKLYNRFAKAEGYIEIFPNDEEHLNQVFSTPSEALACTGPDYKPCEKYFMLYNTGKLKSFDKPIPGEDMPGTYEELASWVLENPNKKDLIMKFELYMR